MTDINLRRRLPLLLLFLGNALALSSLARRGLNMWKALDHDFADPAHIHVNGTWWAFATNDHKGSNVQVASSIDMKNWNMLGKDALPKVGAWANSGSPAVWAPHVHQNDNGKFVMYYSARAMGHAGTHCIGAAQSDNVQGPYTPFDKPLACPIEKGGAIDGSAFQDVDGKRYFLYKVDGNSIGHGGNCGNSIEPIVSTPIMLQGMEGDGHTLRGSAIPVLDRGFYDGPLVEAPSLTRTSTGKYVLFFSSNCFAGPLYDVSYAVANSITGPYVKTGMPFAVTGTAGLYAPGGLTVAADGKSVVFHASNGHGGRGMYAASISIDKNGLVTT